ncbi:MAG: ferrous iron transport protein B [Kangiellaceae bacterium]|nr:ferrous iron transport protein B [Kangiellaceae bacterium]|tara:strand:+ start:2358 stop:4667 length:2310 start_codon:yes stop_codon:yes gene_type:complete
MNACAYQPNQSFRICLAGNPNAGKTSVFNALTGSRQHVGNWPGVTVERKEGELVADGVTIQMIDLPGTYNLTPTVDGSEDERIAASYLWQHQEIPVLAVVDATNLQRNLFLTFQLIEQQRPMLVVLTKVDGLSRQQRHIEVEKLEHQLGVPCIAINARDKQDIKKLRSWLVNNINEPAIPRPQVTWSTPVSQAISSIAYSHEGLSEAAVIGLLDDNLVLCERLPSLVTPVKQVQQHIKSEQGRELDELIAESRYRAIEHLTADIVMDGTLSEKTSITTMIDRLALNKYLGLPIFLMMMYLMFTFAVNIGAVFIDFFDILAGTLLIDLPVYYLEQLGAPALLISLIQGIGGGIQTVATFIPVVGFLFIAMTALEDSGYLARAAFVVDRIMRALHLPGKAFVPMLLGFGCNVPAIMAARTLTHPNDRKLVVCMTPFMSCTARLPVFVMIGVALFAESGNTVVAAMYFIGIAFAILSGWLIRKTLLPGGYTPLVMELPSYQVPHVHSLLMHSWHRLKSFIVDAGKIIIVMVMAITMLNSLGSDGSLGNEDSENSLLAVVAKSVTPVLSPLGIEEDNWPATVGIVTGLLAKEAVAGTLTNLYQGMAEQVEEGASVAPSAWSGVTLAVASIADNFFGLKEALIDPVGISGANEDAKSEYQQKKAGFDTMAKLFVSTSSAFAYMLFILLYTPCAAALGAIKRELNMAWMVFLSLWTLGLAWCVATLYYQCSMILVTPWISIMWMGAIAAVLALALYAMHRSRPRQGDAIIALVGA